MKRIAFGTKVARLGWVPLYRGLSPVPAKDPRFALYDSLLTTPCTASNNTESQAERRTQMMTRTPRKIHSCLPLRPRGPPLPVLPRCPRQISTTAHFYQNRQLELYASKEAHRLTLRQLVSWSSILNFLESNACGTRFSSDGPSMRSD